MRLMAAHLEHGFRGAESQEDAAYVAALCARLGVPCRVVHRDVPALQRRRHLSAQEAARSVRHAFLQELAAETGAERIALGHTRDDRAETVLLNLLRGSGLDGLAAMPPVALPIVRPLLEVGRADTVAYCERHALAPRIDSSNAKQEYRRNRMRAELLPYLVTYYNAGVADTLVRMAHLAEEDRDYLEAQARVALSAMTIRSTETEIVLDASLLAQSPPALQRRAVRAAIAQLRGTLQDVGFDAVERLLEAVRRGETDEQTLPLGQAAECRVRYAEGFVRVWKPPLPVMRRPWQTLLQIPGITELAECGLIAEAQVCGSAAEVMRWLDSRGRTDPGWTLVFPAVDCALPLLARSWQPGDRIRPKNLGGSKKLQDLFTDSKIPSAERSQHPVLVTQGGMGRILAVVGVRADACALIPELSDHPDRSDLSKETGVGECVVLRFAPILSESGR